MPDKDHFTNADAGADLYEWLARVRRERRTAVLATVVAVTGSAPQVPGAKLLLLDDGRVVGTVGGGAFERQVLERAGALLRGAAESGTRLETVNLTTDLGMCCGGTMEIFLERVRGAERLIVFGAGHVARPLCRLAAEVGFEVTVVDEREAWATPERFPAARSVICEEPEVALPELVLDEATWCVVVTHDHPLDQRLVRALLDRPLRFLGLVGSRAKRNKFRMRLAAQGVPEERLDRLRSPLGLAIGAVTPEEIAVSIVAELVAVRRGALAAAPERAVGEGAGRLRPARRIAPEEDV